MGIFCERINSFAKIFDDSIRAADLSGPNTRNFSLVNRSTIPAARGSSGPTTVRSTRFSFANLTSAIKSLTGIATFSAISPVPAFPGAQKIRSTCGDCRSFQVSACSRPPLPITRILIKKVAQPSRLRRKSQARGSRYFCARDSAGKIANSNFSVCRMIVRLAFTLICSPTKTLCR